MKNDSTASKQATRILAALQASRERIPMPDLSRIGSGKPDGFCASFTRRISDLRKQGQNILTTEQRGEDGSRHTFYELIRVEQQQQFSKVN